AGILPFRRRYTLSDTETKNLYLAMKKVLSRIRDIMSERSLDEIAIEKRDFLSTIGVAKYALSVVAEYQR
ncbi:MAG: hypothetical protein ACXACG_14275, partial [Candidatus Thorarchaeota archaeon]